MNIEKLKKIIILSAVVLVLFFYFKPKEGFQSSGLYTLIGIQIENANIDDFIKSTTAYADMFSTIKDLNGSLIWTSGSQISTGSKVTNFIVYINPQPPTTLLDAKSYVTNLKINLNSAYGKPAVLQFIFSTPTGVYVNENGDPVKLNSSNILFQIGLLTVLAIGIVLFVKPHISK
jgi:hypothetical protein